MDSDIRHNIIIRPALTTDLAAITAIYAREVCEGTATFEYDPPGAQEIKNRYDQRVSAGYPWLVADDGGTIAGYAYASALHTRPGYRFTVEDTIYLDQRYHRQGIGTRLLEELIGECEARDFRQMLALIGDSANTASIRLHERCGFSDAGVWKSSGWKFNRWIDVIVMQRALGDGARNAPIAIRGK